MQPAGERLQRPPSSPSRLALDAGDGVGASENGFAGVALGAGHQIRRRGDQDDPSTEWSVRDCVDDVCGEHSKVFFLADSAHIVRHRRSALGACVCRGVHGSTEFWYRGGLPVRQLHARQAETAEKRTALERRRDVLSVAERPGVWPWNFLGSKRLTATGREVGTRRAAWRTAPHLALDALDPVNPNNLK